MLTCPKCNSSNFTQRGDRTTFYCLDCKTLFHLKERRERKPIEELKVKEGVIYTIGELDCDRCGRHYVIKCDGKRNWLE